MSFSVQPDEVIGIADRVRLALDDALDHSNALRDATASVSDALAGLPPARAAFDEVASVRVARLIVADSVAHHNALMSDDEEINGKVLNSVKSILKTRGHLE